MGGGDTTSWYKERPEAELQSVRKPLQHQCGKWCGFYSPLLHTPWDAPKFYFPRKAFYNLINLIDCI